MTLKITDKGRLALTDAELNIMQRLLDAHDRGMKSSIAMSTQVNAR
jgi:hypothetical protein